MRDSSSPAGQYNRLVLQDFVRARGADPGRRDLLGIEFASRVVNVVEKRKGPAESVVVRPSPLWSQSDRASKVPIMARLLRRDFVRGLRVALLIPLGLIGLAGSSTAQQFPGDPGSPDTQVLARGPIHEAFASPIVFNPTPGVVTPKPPPSTVIEELPPAQRPQGANVEWIPGYWSWDDERADYIWISGIWRDVPPGRQWVPGYWSQAQNGFLWTSGFWAPTAANGQFNYLPAPPQSLENGPNVPQPGPDYSWLPGSWVWTQDRYAWQPGYWVQANPDWVWTPSSYVPTPSGYLYNDGYWDYSLQRRGLAFAPVAFGPSAYAQRSFAYSPTIALPVAGLLSSLFVRPSYGHYYFGDYYNAASRGPRSGYVPWFGLQQNRIGYDPIYASMSALNARQPEWDRRIREDYRERLENRQPRPAPTFEGQRALIEQRQGRGEDVRNLGVVQPLHQWASNPGAYHRFDQVAQENRVEMARRQLEVHNVGQDRARMEAQGRIPANVRPEEHRPQRIELPRSPIAAARGPHPQGATPAGLPPHPEAHQAFRPTFEREPALIRANPGPRHEEPRPGPARPEAHPAAQPRPPHNEPKPTKGAVEHPKPR
jgi:WXXGXW repeat (2 copies)